MFGRMFGRGKDEGDQPACSQCGRTLLAGEWTQKVVDDDGRERLICSLCAQEEDLTAGEPHTVTASASTTSRDARADSDAFWRALKDKDAQIDRLEQQLARAEAEKHELAGQLARLQTRQDEGAEPAAATPTEAPSPADMPPPAWAAEEPASATWGETPAELAAAVAEFEARSATAEPPDGDRAAIAAEDTQPIPAVGVEPTPAADDATAGAASPTPDAEDAELPGELASEAGGEPSGEPAGEPEAVAADESASPADEPASPADESASPADEPASPADVEADAASLTLLQRGVDLLNVSSVPRKIAETNEHLGLSNVHVGFDGQVVAVTFLWSMGWYRFHVDIDSGVVRLDERGYEERDDLWPNAAVRADGTVQLAAAQISRAAAQRAQLPPEPQPAPAERPTEPEPPSVAAQKPPEILSKSLLGQRSDDEPDPWGQTQAREFDWDR